MWRWPLLCKAYGGVLRMNHPSCCPKLTRKYPWMILNLLRGLSFHCVVYSRQQFVGPGLAGGANDGRARFWGCVLWRQSAFRQESRIIHRLLAFQHLVHLTSNIQSVPPIALQMTALELLWRCKFRSNDSMTTMLMLVLRYPWLY